MRHLVLLLPFVITMTITGCGLGFNTTPGGATAVKSRQAASSLEVPPDLMETTSEEITAAYSAEWEAKRRVAAAVRNLSEVLVTSSPDLEDMHAFAEELERTAARFADTPRLYGRLEWIRTGDKYRVDEQGFFWYQGRSDDMLKVGGIWVSPFEVEAAVLEHEAVQEVAVVGCEDDDGLVKPKAFVVLKPASEAPDEAELKRFVKEQIAVYKYPRWIEFVDELPKTATGKIQRYRLR